MIERELEQGLIGRLIDLKYTYRTDIRRLHRDWRSGRIDDATYRIAMKEEIAHVVREQEEIGLDVLVHGEAERNDMVEYFGEQLSGFAFTANG